VLSFYGNFLLLNAGLEHYYTLSEFPQTVEKKVKLLNYFRNYMKEHLLKAGANIEVTFFPYFQCSGSFWYGFRDPISPLSFRSVHDANLFLFYSYRR
jgi:hypothetical protein